jgi:hypothetical protein
MARLAGHLSSPNLKLFDGEFDGCKTAAPLSRILRGIAVE